MRALLLAGLLLATFASAPAGQAQVLMEGDFSLDSATLDRESIKPNLETAKMSVAWSYDVGQASAVLMQGSHASIDWDVGEGQCDRPGVLLIGSFSDIIVFPVGWNGHAEGVATFTVSVTDEAPGETAIRCRVQGQVMTSGPFYIYSNPSEIDAVVRAAYDGLLSAKSSHSVAQGPAGKAMVFNVEVRNLGNSATNVKAELVGDAPAGWQVVLPTAVVLGSDREGSNDTSATMTLMVTPLANAPHDQVTFAMRLIGSSTRDPSQQTDPVTLAFVARVGDQADAGAAAPLADEVSGARGKIAPGAGPLLLLGLLGLAMVVRRRVA